MSKTGAKTENICSATVPVRAPGSLAHLFLCLTDLADVPWHVMMKLSSLPLHNRGQAKIDGEPLPSADYSNELEGATGLGWALLRPETLVGKRLVYVPYDGAEVAVEPVSDGQGWTATASVVMNPDTPLQLVMRHRKLLVSFIVVGGQDYKLKDNTGVLHMAFQSQV